VKPFLSFLKNLLEASTLHSLSSPFVAEKASEEPSRPGDGGGLGVRSGPGRRHRRFRQALLPLLPPPSAAAPRPQPCKRTLPSHPTPFSLLETRPRPAHDPLLSFQRLRMYVEYSSEMWKGGCFCLSQCKICIFVGYLRGRSTQIFCIFWRELLLHTE
jgi:hypothetical protein